MLDAFAGFQFERWPSFLDRAPRGIVYDMPFVGFIQGAYVSATLWDHPWVCPIEGDLTGYPLAVVVGGTVDYFRAGIPHGFYFFPGVHPEEAVAYDLIAEALAAPFGPRR